MTRIRVLAVEDSLTMRKHLVEALEADPQFQVIAEATDGQQAIELCQRLRPDVITMDMMLPIMTGMAATEYIMAYCPTPILIVSASTNRGELFKTYQALAAGAVDVFEKPFGDERDLDWERAFRTAVRVVSKVRVVTHPRARLRGQSRPTSVTPDVHGEKQKPGETTAEYRVAALGVSTGGPQALAEILGSLPANFPLPLLIVIHISTAFGSAFAEWLNDQTPIPVRTAIHRELLPPVGKPVVVLAPPDRHLEVRQGRLWLTEGPEVHSCRPSVDVLFDSIADEIGKQAIAAVLTGMGRDGARGLLAIRTAGGMTIAQDEATSVVFGMPREAILMGAAHRILPLQEIGKALCSFASAKGSSP